jgi:6-phosphogluconolactonase (cycloisomerase 2 family)
VDDGAVYKRSLIALAAAAVLLFPAAAGAARHVYVAGSGSDSVGAAEVGADGSLTPVAGSPFATGTTGPEAIVVTPGGSNAFVSHHLSAGPLPLVAFGVGQDGALSSLPGSPFGGDSRVGLAVTPDGTLLYGLDQFHDAVVGFSIGESGSPTPLPGFPTASGGNLPVAVAVTPDGRHLYVVNRGSANVQGFAIADGGGLTALSTAAVGSTPFALAVTPDGAHLYVANAISNDISAFAIEADGSLAPVAGSPFVTGGAGSFGLAMAPDGRHLYATNRVSGDVSAFAISSEGALTTVAGSPFAAPATAGSPIAGAVTPDSSYLYVASYTGTNVAGFRIDAAGGLAALPGSPYALGVVAPDVWSIAVSPDQPPQAEFSAPAGISGAPATFDASSSTDADSEIVRHEWDFGDGGTATTSSPTTSHTYANPGVYQVRLALTDSEGCSTAFVHTGQTASCNGAPSAAVERTVSVRLPDPLPASGVRGAADRSCVSGRNFRIRLRSPRGRRIVSAVVRLDGKRVRTRRGPPITARIDLRGRKPGRHTVSIRIRLDNGRLIRRKRTYRTCGARSASHDGW